MSEALDTLQNIAAGLDEPLAGPTEHAILVLEIMWAFGDMLSHDQNGQVLAAEAARQRCIYHATELRAFYDPDPALGPDRADATIAWAVRNARYLFARELPPQDLPSQIGAVPAFTGFAVA